MSSRRPSTQSSIYSARLSGSPASTPSSTAGRKHKKQKKEKKKSKNEGKTQKKSDAPWFIFETLPNQKNFAVELADPLYVRLNSAIFLKMAIPIKAVL